MTHTHCSGNRFSSATASLFATKVLPVYETLRVLRVSSRPSHSHPSHPPSLPPSHQMGKNSMQKMIAPREDHGQLPEPAADVAGLLEAATACSSLSTLDLSGFTFTLDMADKVAGMRETRPDLTVIFGGTGGHVRVKPLAPPLEKLVRYTTEHALVLEDLFRSFDKEQTGQLSGDEFRTSLQVGCGGH